MYLQLYDLLDKYTSFDNLIQAINTFVSLQCYAVVNKNPKLSNKRVLIYD